MRQILKALALAALLLPGIAAAQTPQYPQTLPANTVWGRLGVSSGPPQAIPFATLSARLTGATITLNSGNGQTAPGSMAGGNTYTFGANTDTPRFAGIGLGGAAPATGIEVYNAAATPTANGQGMFGAASVNGGMLLGQGSVYDASIANKSSAVALGVPTGTTGVVLAGTLTAASLSTVGAVAGSICATSAGLILYEAGVNCFTVSGISVASGKTLTVSNTLTFTGTDGTSFAFPGASDSVATLAATQTVSGNKTFSGTLNITGTGQLNGTAFGTFATQNFATPPAIGGTTPNIGAFSTLTATTPVGLTSGGTNASTAATARASGGLNIDQITPHGDSNYQILVTDRTVATSATLTIGRIWTLPAASGVNPGQSLYVQDFKGFVSNTNTLTIARNGSDTINGGTGSQVINSANGGFLLISDGTSNWSAQALGAQATAGVANLNGQTGSVNIVAGTGTSVSTSGGNVTVTNAGVASLNGQTGAIVSYFEPQGRLTLQTAVPVMSSTQSAKTTIYYTPYHGNIAPIFDGTNMVPTPYSELSVLTTDTTKSPAAIGASKVNDWFVWNDAGTVRIGHGPDWTSDTARSAGTALVMVNGIYLNSIAITNGPGASRGTYVGTTRSNGSSQLDWIYGGVAAGGTAGFFGVWNAYNRVNVASFVGDSTDTWTYALATWRAADNSASYRVSYVCGLAEDTYDALYSSTTTAGAASASFGAVGVGFNSTTAATGQQGFLLNAATGGNIQAAIIGTAQATALGFNFFSAIEYSVGGTTTFAGDQGAPLVTQSGLTWRGRM